MYCKENSHFTFKSLVYEFFFTYAWITIPHRISFMKCIFQSLPQSIFNCLDVVSEIFSNDLTGQIGEWGFSGVTFTLIFSQFIYLSNNTKSRLCISTILNVALVIECMYLLALWPTYIWISNWILLKSPLSMFGFRYTYVYSLFLLVSFISRWW